MSWWDELAELAKLLEPYLPYLEILVTVVAAISLERLATRRVRKAVERLQLPPDAGNAIILALRVGILVAACIIIMNIGGVPSSWLVGLSALGGTAIGFASTRSVGNLISGIYLMISRPFGIGDYVRIDGLEGEVVEITVNYTKLRAPDGTTILISNQKVLDSKVMNFTREVEGRKLIKCDFAVGFDHSIPSEEIERALKTALAKWTEELPAEPELVLNKWDKGGKEYTVTFYVEDAGELRRVKHALMSSVLRAWEELKTRSS